MSVFDHLMLNIWPYTRASSFLLLGSCGVCLTGDKGTLTRVHPISLARFCIGEHSPSSVTCLMVSSPRPLFVSVLRNRNEVTKEMQDPRRRALVLPGGEDLHWTPLFAYREIRDGKDYSDVVAMAFGLRAKRVASKCP
ncbi:hypothetical protein M433DRAFT_452722 [Acidomyces richmondensis BFW]|nr:MAG: hypothetical protein FE78DRAFT_264377 [Acidomyces sp. 'richmondensis']KYG41799.1 hypothetical protein M433DRAFT_452722 [Acidomyces richmondensis BFW]